MSDILRTKDGELARPDEPWPIVLTADEAETLWYLLDNAWTEIDETEREESARAAHALLVGEPVRETFDLETLARERAVIRRTVAQLPEQPWPLGLGVRDGE